MNYNTQRDYLVMPEYGRVVQDMVDYAVQLPTKEKRQQCAEYVISVMARLQSAQAGQTDFMHKLWNHLARIAHYELDIDYPVEIIPEEEAMQHPAPLAYPMKKIQHRHYGHLLEACLQHARELPEGEERDAYLSAVANQMKLSLSQWNPDSMDDQLVATDIERYTEGELGIDLESFRFEPITVTSSARNAGHVGKKQKKNR